MYNPFHDIPSGPASERITNSTIKGEQKVFRYHVNNPLHHRFPLLKRLEETILWKFYNYIPVLDHVPQRAHLFFGSLYLAILTGVFVFMFIRGYLSGRSQYYLSPLTSDSASTNCELIPATNTGTFYGTVTGHWQGTYGFSFSEAAYVLTVSSFSADYAYYANTFTSIYAALAFIGLKAKNQDLGRNSLYWMSTTFSADATNAQRVNLVGNPNQVFNREYHRASLGGVNKTCNILSETKFDTNTAVLTASFQVEDFYKVESNDCLEIMRPDLMGYDFIAKPPNFDLRVDLRSLITVVAMNTGVLVLPKLVRVSAMDKTVVSGGVTKTLYAYYDAKYPGMVPIFCLNDQYERTFCIMEIGGIPAFPFLHHTGKSLLYPSRCTCSALTEAELADRTHACHAFRFITGFYYWPQTTDIAPILEVTSQYLSISKFHDAGFTAAFYSSSFAKIDNITQTIHSLGYTLSPSLSLAVLASPSERQARIAKSFKFCNSPTYGNCSIFTVSSYDIYSRGSTISEYYFQLDKGACRDSFTPNQTAWHKLIEEPFAPLSQQYQQCRDDRRTLFINQAGITIGNIQILGPFCIMFVLALGVLYRYCLFAPDPQEKYDNLCNFHYSKTEKQKVLEAVATAMLIHRDHIIVDRLNEDPFDDEDKVKDEFEDSLIRKFVEDVIDHYNNPETKERVMEFLKTPQEKEIERKRPKAGNGSKIHSETSGPHGKGHIAMTRTPSKPLPVLKEANTDEEESAKEAVKNGWIR